MRIASVSDIHGQWKRPTYPPADVLIFAGDILGNYTHHFSEEAKEKDADQQLIELQEFVNHVGLQDYDEIVVVAGNHDFVFERRAPQARKILENHHFTYLKDEAKTITVGDESLVFYGSPYQPWFHDWAFNFPPTTADGGNNFRARAAAKECWQKIPDNVDVLITHTPPRDILDECPDGRRVGCQILAQRLEQIHPKAHYFGHIHHSAGIETGPFGTMFKNTALLGEDYQTMREITIEIVQGRSA